MITIGMIKNFTLKSGAKRSRRVLKDTRHNELRYQLELGELVDACRAGRCADHHRSSGVASGYPPQAHGAIYL